MGLLDLFIKQSNKLSSEELKKMMEGSTSVKLIDVRTKEEYAEGHIPNSINIPLQDFKDSIKKMNLPLDTHIVVYCASGIRSRQAYNILNKLGFKSIWNFGGINNWKYKLKY